ncbi:metal tolerance protein 5-like isoform X2 [Triticum dicoccoides]|uniref:metal tolerance protein 5-like isoform X2 n=1 Tax=Triticum dicoccoides TaxID=85692 RepID=UPI0018908CCA|nr:metal tolerance protein 5-like isoform X2 [Triticum dicoccoides]
MAAGGSGEQGEELFLLRSAEEGEGDGDGLCVGERPWRLNFDGFRRQGPQQENPPSRGLQDCLGVLGNGVCMFVLIWMWACGIMVLFEMIVWLILQLVIANLILIGVTAQGPGDVVAEYYQQQLEMLEGFDEMDTLTDRGCLPGISKEEREKIAQSETLAIRLSNIANMVLFAAKVYASIRSGSLAIIASTLDSLLDLLSGFILWFTAFSMQTPNPYRYPIGKRRMQPLGILVFASVMATLGLQIILESIRSLVSSNGAEFRLTKEQEMWVVNIMLAVTLVKLLLVIYCRSFTNEIVKAYAQDHFFDVITNIIGLVAALLANYFEGWIDPVGAIILAIYTIRTWSMTVLENVHSLVGQSASPEFLQKLTYLCWNHHKAVRHIDTVRAYTFGSHYFVEVDIVLPCDMPLQEAHDIGEALQEKLESLPEIERAFVHLDYEFTHQPEHARSYDT